MNIIDCDRRHVRSCLVLCTLLLATIQVGIWSVVAAQTNSPSAKVDESILRGPSRPDAYIDAIGRAAAWMGTEEGTLEAWIWPYKILHSFNLAARTGEIGSEIDLTGLARNVEVRPYSVQIDYVHSRFSVRQTLMAAATEPLLFMFLEVDSSTDITLVVSFIPDLEPMWPAGMGGQYAFFDGNVPGYVLSESRRSVNAVVGSPDASRGSSAPAHQLSDANAFAIPVSRGRAERGPILLVVTGGEETREVTLERYNRAVSRGIGLLEDREDAFAGRPATVKLELPYPRLEEAYLWAVSSLVDGHQFTPGLGTGLVAGFGPTGNGYRPGFSWYFGGDTSINSFGLVAAGHGWVLSDAFPFLERFQRNDGKMMHELSRSAGLIDWFGEYPYAFIHGDTTPFYIVALANYFRWTNDRDLLERSWPNLLKAYEFCRWADEDGDGLMDNSRAGLGASELGSLREGLKTGVFIATVWTQALSDLAYLADIVGETDRGVVFANEHERAKDRMTELFIDSVTGTLNFGVSVSGEPKNDATAWAAFPVIFGLIGGEAAENTLDMVASARITSDWVTRMLAEDSPFYDPVGYNNGAVWPFLTGYVAMAEYAAGRRYPAYQHLCQVAGNTFIDALGRHPEVMSGDYYTVLETSVPHQLFSSSPIPANLVRGVIGLDLDLPNNTVYVRPQLPGGWPGVKLEGFPVGSGNSLDLEIGRHLEGDKVRYDLTGRGPGGLKIVFAPRPAPLERLDDGGVSEMITGADGSVKLAVGGAAGIELILDRLSWGPVSEGPVRTLFREGDPPCGLRILRVEEKDRNRVTVTMEGRTGYIYKLPVESSRAFVVNAQAAVLIVGDTRNRGNQSLLLSVSPETGEAVGVDGYRRFIVEIQLR